ncbi:hypothetical protein FRACYDRAFT_258825 [Fragilariopsis cylindrus CCMP1102]|uniref:Uncharacterized protein n=1 Tax=Fragilariopsis cylindrus CCMP1102 TaxID=635003 RepID=A0A1E7FVI9_9STRA|nr:hypothetical protein FRACYDRAFT_258825 [Fragilariopsis cylindrus CCMP1102]|eukprot:OEU21853.1 hypothetical protein FRACYDRAFT_258825 [Fragilariopsis cylindrus CCMP1102]
MANSDLLDDDDDGSAFDNTNTNNNTTSSIPANTDDLHQQSSLSPPPPSGSMDFALPPPSSADIASDVQDVDLQQQQHSEPNEQEQELQPQPQPQRQASINLLDFGAVNDVEDTDLHQQQHSEPNEQEQQSQPQPQRQASINLLDFGAVNGVEDADLQQQQQQHSEPNEQEQQSQPQRQASINLLHFGAVNGVEDADLQQQQQQQQQHSEPNEREQQSQPQRQASINLLDFGGEGIDNNSNNNNEGTVESTQNTQQSPFVDVLDPQPHPTQQQQEQEQLLDIFAGNNDTTSMPVTTKRDSFAPVDPSQQQSTVLDSTMMAATDAIPPAAATTITTVPKSGNEDPFGVFMHPTKPQSQQQQPAGTLISDPFLNISTPTTTTSTKDSSIQPSLDTATDDIEKAETTTTTSSEIPTLNSITDAATNSATTVVEKNTVTESHDDVIVVSSDSNNTADINQNDTNRDGDADKPSIVVPDNGKMGDIIGKEREQNVHDDNASEISPSIVKPVERTKDNEESDDGIDDDNSKEEEKQDEAPASTTTTMVVPTPEPEVSEELFESVDVSSDKEEDDDGVDDDDNKEEKKEDETPKVLPSTSTTTTIVAPTSEPEISEELFESVSLLDDILDDNNEDETKQDQDNVPKTAEKEDQDYSVRNDNKTEINTENNSNKGKTLPVESENEEKDKEQEQERVVNADALTLTTTTTSDEQILVGGRSIPGSEVTKRFANFKNLAAGAVAGQTQRFQNVQVPQRFQNVQVPQRFSRKNFFGGGNKASDDIKPPVEEQDTAKTITADDVVNNPQSSTPVPNSEVQATSTVSSEAIPFNHDECNNNCTSEKSTIPSVNPKSQSTDSQVPATVSNTNDSVGDELEGSFSDREIIPSENTIEANNAVNHETEKMSDIAESSVTEAEKTNKDSNDSKSSATSPISSKTESPSKESNATTAHDISKAAVDSSETNPINVDINENTASSITPDRITTTSSETSPFESAIAIESADDTPPLAAEPESDSATSSTTAPQPLQTISKPLPDTSHQVELLQKELHAAHTTIMQLQHHDDVEEKRPGDAVMVEIQANLQKEMNRRAEAEEKARVVMAKSQTVGEEYKTFKIESTKNLDELTCKYEILNKEKDDMKKELTQIREERDEQARKEMALTTRLNGAKKKEAVKANAAEHYEEQVDQLESYVKDYKSQLETLTIERDQLQEELEEWKQYAEKRTKQLETALNDEKKLNNERKTKMKGFVEAKTEEVRSAKADYLSLQTELDQNTSSLTELNHRYKQLHAQWVQSQTRNRELQRDMMKIKKDSEKMNKVGGSLEARLSRSAQQSEDHKNKRIHARNELMSVLGQLEAERAVNTRLQESIKMTFTPKALSQQQTIQEALDDFEGALQKLSARLGRPLAPNTNDSMMGGSSVDNQSLDDDGSIGINSMNGTGEGDDGDEDSNISSGTVTLSEINTNRAVQKLENETQRVSRNVLAFSSSVERMNGLLDGAGTRNCVDAALSSILMMGGVGGGGTITNGNATPGGTNSTRRSSARGGQRYGQISANLT